MKFVPRTTGPNLLPAPRHRLSATSLPQVAETSSQKIRTPVISTRHTAKASPEASLCRARRWPFVRVERRRPIFSLSSSRPWKGSVFTRSWPAAGSYDAGGLAVDVGVETRGDFCVAVCEAAAISDVAEVLAGVGCIGAVECDGCLGGDLKWEEEEGGEEERDNLGKHFVWSETWSRISSWNSDMTILFFRRGLLIVRKTLCRH